VRRAVTLLRPEGAPETGGGAAGWAAVDVTFGFFRRVSLPTCFGADVSAGGLLEPMVLVPGVVQPTQPPDRVASACRTGEVVVNGVAVDWYGSTCPQHACTALTAHTPQGTEASLDQDSNPTMLTSFDGNRC